MYERRAARRLTRPFYARSPAQLHSPPVKTEKRGRIRCGLTRATIALLLSLSTVSGALAPDRVEPVASAPVERRESGRGSLDAGERAADREIERRVRGAIRADPFLVLARPAVRVTCRRGIVRLVGRVGTAKERSSIAFKAGQNARAGRVDDRVTIGDPIERPGR